MATLENLLVQIDASTALLREELRKGSTGVDEFARKTDKQLGGLSGTFNKVAASMRGALGVLGIGLSVTAVVNFTRNAIGAADAIGESAKAAGFGAERFQRLQYVFGQTGVGAEEFGSAMRTLNTRLGQFILTGAGPAKNALEKLGLAQRVLSGEITTSEQLFDAASEAMRRVGSETEKVAIRAELFGRGVGTKMGEALNKTAEEAKKAEAAAAGILSDQRIAQADKLADGFGRLSKETTSWAKALAIAATYQASRVLGMDEAQFSALTTEQQIDELRESRKTPPGDWSWDQQDKWERDIDQEIARLEARLRYEKLINTPFMPARPAPTGEMGKGQELSPQLAGFIAALEEQERLAKELAQGQKLSPELTTFIDDLERAEKLHQSMRSEVEKQVAQWREAKQLFDQGLLSGEDLARLQDSLLKPVEVTAERMKEYSKATEEARERQQRFADTIAATFESRGVEALMSGKIRDGIRGFAKDLAELVIRMTVLQPIAEKLSSALSGIGKGKGTGSSGGVLTQVLGGFFGFAEGGRPPINKPSLVGEKGPELFWPDVAGRIMTAEQVTAAVSGEKTDDQLAGIRKFASGGRPPLNRPSIVGEDGPELFVPDVAGKILNSKQVDAAVGGGKPNAPKGVLASILGDKPRPKKTLDDAVGALLRFAAGGRPPMNKPSLVGEDGPELFWPDSAGRMMSAATGAETGGGVSVQITQRIEAGLPPQWDAQLAIAGRVGAQAAYEAVMKTLGGRK